jgi:tetratricopeptide (TPR) repeat protein
LYYEMGKIEDAVAMYDKAMEISLRTENNDLITSIRDETDEKNVLKSLSEKNLYNLGAFLEKHGRYEEAARSYGLHIELFRASSVRPKAIYRVHVLFRDRLSNASMAQCALAYLQKEYPEWLRG